MLASRRVLITALLAVLLCWSSSAKSSWLDEEDVTGDDAPSHDQHHTDAEPDRAKQHHSHHRRDSTDLANLAKSEQIALLEDDLVDLRQGRLSAAIDKAHRAASALQAVKGNSGWFPNAETKARIAQLDQEVTRRMNELATVQRDEKALISRLKPLYGIVSVHFVQEQKTNMANSLKTLQDMSYNQAWYSSLFNAHRAESITDVIIGFFIEWLLGYLIMYPFAVAYYALWTLPWSLFEYSSGVESVFPAVVAYVLAVTIMLLPLACIVGGIGYAIYKNRDALRNFAEQRQQQRAAFRAAPLHGRQQFY